jgi:hypothetical protein
MASCVWASHIDVSALHKKILNLMEKGRILKALN